MNSSDDLTDTIESTPLESMTDEQRAIIEHDVAAGECVKVVAYAGTGKTYTFVVYSQKRSSVDMLYLAFNKSVAEEAKGKFGQNVLSKTIHALAYASVGRQYKEISNGLKTWQIAKMAGVQTYPAALIRMSLENFLNSADEEPLQAHVVPDELNRLGLGYEGQIVEAVKEIFEKMLTKQVPMTHSGYLKQYQLQKPRVPFSTILLDEAQDTNQVTQSIVMDQLKYGTRIILCGDPYQQIYAWRGATDAMSKIDCVTFRLTQSFRFGDNVAQVANALLSKLLGEHVPVRGTEQKDPDKPSRCIICRTNAGLFNAARRSRSFSVVGEPRFLQLLDDLLDIGRFYKGGRPRSPMYSFYRSFKELVEKATESLDYELIIRSNIVEALGSELVYEVANVRQKLSNKEDAETVLVTGHQAKGLEWDEVTLESDFPSLYTPEGKLKAVVKHADKNSETEIAQEEVNLLYVACTRAKKKLNAGSEVARLLKSLSVESNPSSLDTDGCGEVE